MGRDKFLQFAGSAHDVLATLAAFYAAHMICYGVDAVLSSVAFLYSAVFFVVGAAACFALFSLNCGAWRYASLADLIAIVKASFMANAIYSVGEQELSGAIQFSPSVLPLIFIFMVCGLGGPRLAYRVAKERGYLRKITGEPASALPRRQILLLGANRNAQNYIRKMRRSGNRDVLICGIADENARVGQSIQGVKVLGRQGDIGSIVSRLRHRGLNVSDLVVTSNEFLHENIDRLISVATCHGLKLSQIRDVSNPAIRGNKVLEPNPVQIGDLLGRAEIHLDTAATSEFLTRKTLLITGAGGSIASELARQVAVFNPRRLVLTDMSEYLLFMIGKEMRECFPGVEIISKIADIRDQGRMDGLMRSYKPDVVFHAAALKHVPITEDNILESVKTNVLGVRNMADCSIKHAVRCFVLISTDKAVNPTNIMGATKRVAEAYCQSLDRTVSTTHFKTVRFGNVLGSNGSVVPLFEEQIASGGPVTITHPDVARYFMTVQEAARLVLKASAHQLPNRQDRGRIHVLNMGEPVRIYDLAVKMIELAGLRPHRDIEIVCTGLRPGEKLREELFVPEEQTGIIVEDGFVLASARHVEPATINMMLMQLEKAVGQDSESKAIKALKKIVPEYCPERLPREEFEHLEEPRKASA